MGGRETKREARVRERERAPVRPNRRAHLRVPGPSQLGDARPSAVPLKAAPLNRHAHVPSARSVAVSCTQTRHRAASFASRRTRQRARRRHYEPRQRPAVPPIPFLGVAHTGTLILLARVRCVHVLARTHALMPIIDSFPGADRCRDPLIRVTK